MSEAEHTKTGLRRGRIARATHEATSEAEEEFLLAPGAEVEAEDTANAPRQSAAKTGCENAL